LWTRERRRPGHPERARNGLIAGDSKSAGEINVVADGEIAG
jgi:hypothetical protein